MPPLGNDRIDAVPLAAFDTPSVQLPGVFQLLVPAVQEV